MKKGSKLCCICKKFTPEPKDEVIHFHKVSFCHPCYVHLLSRLFNINEKLIRENLTKHNSRTIQSAKNIYNHKVRSKRKGFGWKDVFAD